MNPTDKDQRVGGLWVGGIFPYQLEPETPVTIPAHDSVTFQARFQERPQDGALVIVRTKAGRQATGRLRELVPR